MESKEKDDVIFLRLFPNEDVIIHLKEACKLYNVKSAVVLSGIGQLKNIKLGYFKNKGDYNPEIINKPVELLSLTGNICKDKDDYAIHLHTVLGDENKEAIGGHFIEGQVSITAEIVILKINLNIQRKINEKTGLKDLYLK